MKYESVAIRLLTTVEHVFGVAFILFRLIRVLLFAETQLEFIDRSNRGGWCVGRVSGFSEVWNVRDYLCSGAVGCPRE